MEGRLDAGDVELKVLQDWQCLKKDLIFGDFGIDKVKESHSEFLGFTRRYYRGRYPWLVKVFLIIALVPIGSAECERMFSLMNRLKTDLRNRMKNGVLDNVMTVNRLGPSLPNLTDEDIDAMIDHWKSGCKTGRYTSYFK